MSHYEEYAVLDAQIKALTAQKDGIKVKILEDMVNSGEEKIQTSVGKFSISKLKSWTYSDKVTDLEEKYKAEKAHEEMAGIATFEEKPSLRFTGINL